MAPEIIMMIFIGMMIYHSVKANKKKDKSDVLIAMVVLIVVLIWGNFFDDTLGRLVAKLTKIFGR